MTVTTPSRPPSPTGDGPPRTSYHLLTEPWLLVRADGGVREVGLFEAFERAHEFRGLGGEIPTQEAACLRLMLAILYRTVDQMDLDVPADEWVTWWAQRRLPHDAIRHYLTAFADRFDLLHPHTPFFQVADLRTPGGGTSGLGKLIADMPDGHPFFTMRTAETIARLPFGEAARWLVHAHAYDVSGIKSGAVGDARVKGGRGYPIGTGFAGTLGLVLAEGDTLAETLLLNLVLTMDTTRDRAPWEHPQPGSAADTAHPHPLGPADTATWQARRVRLIHDGYAVTDAVLSNGDAIGPQNRRSVEPNSSWRYSAPQTKKLGNPTYMPLEHSPSRTLWRGLSATLGERTTEAATKADARAFYPAAVLDWLTILRGNGVLDATWPVTLRAIGMVYGSQSASVTAVIDDRLVLPLAVLADPELRTCAVGAVNRADEAVRALGRLASNLADAAGRHLLPGMDNGARDRAVEAAFDRLDQHYRRWIRTLRSREGVAEHEKAWQLTVRRVADDIAGQLVTAAGTPALIGRAVGGRLLTAPIAENFYRSALRTALPLAFPTVPLATPPEAAKEDS